MLNIAFRTLNLQNQNILLPHYPTSYPSFFKFSRSIAPQHRGTQLLCPGGAIEIPDYATASPVPGLRYKCKLTISSLSPSLLVPAPRRFSSDFRTGKARYTTRKSIDRPWELICAYGLVRQARSPRFLSLYIGSLFWRLDFTVGRAGGCYYRWFFHWGEFDSMIDFSLWE